jgi:hypothetical protein
MTALPDILAGLFVYAVLIITLGWDRSGLAAAIALTVTMLPIIARSAEVVLRVVPGGLREASLALGASQWQTVRRVVLPTAKAGLATSLILGIARIAGETAPLLIVSGLVVPQRHPGTDPMNSLPLFIYDAVRRPRPDDPGPRLARGDALLGRPPSLRHHPIRRSRQGTTSMSSTVRPSRPAAPALRCAASARDRRSGRRRGHGRNGCPRSRRPHGPSVATVSRALVNGRLRLELNASRSGSPT